MNPNREEALFALALTKRPAGRAEFLARECADDPALRARLETLLAAHDQPEGVLGETATEAKDTLKLEFADEPRDETIGSTIGHYKVLQSIGEGGCGAVYMAEQFEPVRRRVALKVIKLGMDTKAVIARFEAERQALALMDHPNIAKVLDAGSTDTGRPYFVMELVRGIKITDYCDQNKLDTQQRLDLFIQICQAIQHAHQKGIIHRDIKPSNILVTLHDGIPVPKVIDFGIAKATTDQRLTDKTLFTAYEQFIGTPAYMSPEQAEMSGLDIDTRSDIYSLGVLLYELLTGRTPFDAKELMSLGIDAMRKTIREKEPVRPSTKLHTLQGEDITTTAQSHGADLPKLVHLLRGDLDWIVMKCLEKDRTRRYDTANGLAMDLKRHLSNEPVVARPPSKLYEFQKTVRRHKVGFAATAAVMIALAAGVVVSAWQARVARLAQQQTERARFSEATERRKADQKAEEAEAERRRAADNAMQARANAEQARRNLYAADMNLAQQSLKQNNLGRAVRLLDRHRAQPGEEDLRGWEWRYLWQQTRGSDHVTLTNRPVRGWDVSFSPDGKFLAVGWIDGQVDLWDVPGRRLIRCLTDQETGAPAHVAFSPLGNLLVSTSGPDAVSLLEPDADRESEFWRAPEEGRWQVRRLGFSADAAKLAIYVAGRSRVPDSSDEIWVVDRFSRNKRRYATGYGSGANYHFGGVQLSPDGRSLYLALIDAGSGRYALQCLDLVADRRLWQTDWLSDDRGLSALAVSPDGRLLASGSGYSDTMIRVWDAMSGRLLHELEGHTHWVCDLEFSEDATQLISAATDQTIRFWDTATWTQTRVLRGHRDEVHAVAISRAANLVASASKDGDLVLWNMGENKSGDTSIRLDEALVGRGFKLLDGSRVLFLPPNRPPELIDLEKGSAPAPLSGFGSSDDVLDCFDGRILCRWGGGDQILVHEWRGGEFIPRGAITLGSAVRPSGLAYNDRRGLIAWADSSSPTSVYLADLATPGRRVVLRSDVPGQIPVSFSENGNHLLARSSDREKWRVWHIDSGQVVTSVDERVTSAVFADKGSSLVTARFLESDRHEVVFYDLAHPDRTPSRIPGSFGGYGLAVSPDGGLVAAPTRGSEVLLFDVVKQELIESLHSHLNGVANAAFSPDGERLISRGVDGQVKVWDVETRQELLTLRGAASLARAATWTSDGDVIFDGVSQAWIAPSWEEINAAEAKDKTEARQP